MVSGRRGAWATLVIVPLATGGTEAFLRRVLSRHFGPEVLAIDGVEDFLRAYAGRAGRGKIAKRAFAKLYFGWRGERLYEIGPARELRSRFLRTILTRSNIIAIYQHKADRFDYSSVDPWQPTCGLYLSALSEDSNFG